MTEEQKHIVVESLKKIKDPELNLDIWTLGLVYDIEIKNEHAISFEITYTSPLCPFGPTIKQNIQDEMKLLGFTAVDIEVVFDPPWEPSQELRTMLGI